MVTLILADSNIYIGLLRRKKDPVACLGEWVGSRDLATCGVVRMEVERGLKFEAQRERIARFFDVMIFGITSNAVWAHATEIAWQMDRRGKVLPLQDIVIAAHALELGAGILSDDAHFDEIPGITRLRPEQELAEWR